MAYFKIGTKDYSNLVNELKVRRLQNYNAQTNANGDSRVDLLSSKYEIEVGIIPLDESAVASLLTDVDKFNVLVSFREPQTGKLREKVNCICSSREIEYYTIQMGNVKLKAFYLTFTEL